MGRYFGREPRLSRPELELDARRVIDARVSMGRPPVEDWAPIEARLAELDRERRAPVRPEPVPEPRPKAPLVYAESVAISLREVTLPAAAKAGPAPRTGPVAPAIPVARRPVAAEER